MNIVVQWNLYKQTSMKLSPSLRLLVVTHADTLYKVLEIISKNYCKSYLYLAVNTIKRLWRRSTTYESTNYKRTTGELAIWLTTDNRLTVTIDGSKRTNNITDYESSKPMTSWLNWQTTNNIAT